MWDELYLHFSCFSDVVVRLSGTYDCFAFL